jgi:surface carbohydrate biosynthesis protein (TIGR04326 family)
MLVIGDSKFNSNPKVTLFWDSYSSNNQVESIYNLIEHNKVHVRSEYIKYINDISSRRVNEKSILEHFDINLGFSSWWMSSIAEKNPWKTESIYEILKIIALGKHITDNKIKEIHVYSSDARLKDALKSLANELKIKVTFEHKNYIFNIPDIFSILKFFFIGFSDFLRFVRFRNAFITNKPKSKWSKDRDSIFICSFFINFKNSETTKNYYSNYWGELQTLLNQKKISQNWLHLFVSHDAVKKPKNALKEIDYINKTSTDNDFHALLEQYLSIKICFKVLFKLFHMLYKILVMKNKKQYFFFSNLNKSLWSYYKDDFFSSAIGSVAVKNLFLYFCFEEAIKQLPKQKRGMYLCEDQPWEKALNYFWNKYGHGELVAVLHSPNMRFWDIFNYHHEGFFYKQCPMPYPNKIAINNPKALSEFIKFYSQEMIVEVEALRYIWLDGVVNNRSTISSNKKTKVLILGDYLFETTESLLNIFIGAKDTLNQDFVFSFKPHPSQPMHGICKQLNREERVLKDVITDYDIFFSGNMTYASVDGYVAGLQIIVLRDLHRLNLCPLDKNQAVFISNAPELKNALNKANESIAKSYNQPEKILFINKDLKRWSNFLDS